MEEKKPVQTFTGRLLFCCAMGLLGAAAANVLTLNLCSSWLGVIGDRFELPYIIENGYQWYDPSSLQGPVRIVVLALNFLQVTGIYLYLGGALVLAICFYNRRYVQPVGRAARDAVKRAAEGEYTQSVGIVGEGELGQVCQCIEEMRYLLLREKRMQWNAWEEQRCLNAAFAHDIRTPLTVMRGYIDYLEKYLPQGKLGQEQIMEKLAVIREQENRLYEFTITMSRLQKLEMREPARERISIGGLCQELQVQLDGAGVGKGPGIVLRCEESDRDESFWGDQGVILEAVGNLWSNALRYARNQVVITVLIRDGFLTLYVKDDGRGFSDRSLIRGADPYYREGDGSEHFGLGLTISRILCERHRGGLALANSMEGGAVAAASFRDLR